MIRSFPGIVTLVFAQTLSSAVPASAQNVTEQEAYEIAKDAYVYAYPLLVTNAYMQQATNYAEPTGLVTQAPYNQFSQGRSNDNLNQSPPRSARDLSINLVGYPGTAEAAGHIVGQAAAAEVYPEQKISFFRFAQPSCV